jgi:sugar lactone lactonase YvrE
MVLVGSGDARYAPAEGWEQLPAGWSHPDSVGVAVDAQDRVYVFNRGQSPRSDDHPVIVYERDGTFVRAFGDGLFTMPHAITYDPTGHLYCVDTADHTIRKFTLEGELVQTLGRSGQSSDTGYTTDYRTIQRGGPPFNLPTKLAVAPNGDLFVTDGYGNARVHHFSPDGSVIRSWGEPGDGPGQFNVPHALTVLPDGRLLVIDRENNRIQLFRDDGRYLGEWRDLARPDDLHVDRGGRVFVAELGDRAALWPWMTRPYGHDLPGRVSVLNLDGEVITRFGGDDPYAPGSFFAPHGIAGDSHGDLYVAEVVYAGNGDAPQVELSCHSLQKLVRQG